MVVCVDYYQCVDFVVFYDFQGFCGEDFGVDGFVVDGYYLVDGDLVDVDVLIQGVMQVVIGENVGKFVMFVEYYGYVQVFVGYFYQCVGQ